MSDPISLGILGLGKGYLIDKPKEDRQRALAAVKESTAPWTGEHANAPDEKSPWLSMLQGWAAGQKNAQSGNGAMDMIKGLFGGGGGGGGGGGDDSGIGASQGAGIGAGIGGGM